MDLAKIFTGKAPYDLRLSRIIGRVMADYVYSEGGVFFKKGEDEKISLSSRYHKKKDDDTIRVCTFYYDRRWYVLALDGSFSMATIGPYDSISAYFLEAPVPIQGTDDEVLPDLLTRGKSNDGIEIQSIANGGMADIPTYYTDMFVRTDGIQHYDPEFAVDPLKVNPPPDMRGRRRLVPYDDNGNPILVTKTDRPPPMEKPRVIDEELEAAQNALRQVLADARAARDARIQRTREANEQIEPPPTSPMRGGRMTISTQNFTDSGSTIDFGDWINAYPIQTHHRPVIVPAQPPEEEEDDDADLE